MASRRPFRDVTLFAHIPVSQDPAHRFVPAGRLARAQGAASEPDAMNFAYGTRYLDRPDAFKVEPRALGHRDRQAVRGVALLPLPGLSEFGSIRDAAPVACVRLVHALQVARPPCRACCRPSRRSNRARPSQRGWFRF
jgi:serine/threonine-protein kinase HipA